MKNLLLALTLLLSFSACKKECPSGYEGKNCKTQIREKYYGKYYGITVAKGQSTIVYVDIKENSDCVQCLDASGWKIKLIDGFRFEVPAQTTIINNSAYTVEGTGSFSGNHLIYTTSLLPIGQPAFGVSFAGSK